MATLEERVERLERDVEGLRGDFRNWMQETSQTWQAILAAQKDTVDVLKSMKSDMASMKSMMEARWGPNGAEAEATD